MIGIDITSVSRFKNIASGLPRLGKRFNVSWSTPKEAAKWWACHEAVIKCLGTPPDWNTAQILFNPGSAPKFVGAQQIALSLSHEGDHVIAIAVLDPCQT